MLRICSLLLEHLALQIAWRCWLAQKLHAWQPGQQAGQTGFARSWFCVAGCRTALSQAPGVPAWPCAYWTVHSPVCSASWLQLLPSQDGMRHNLHACKLHVLTHFAAHRGAELGGRCTTVEGRGKTKQGLAQLSKQDMLHGMTSTGQV